MSANGPHAPSVRLRMGLIGASGKVGRQLVQHILLEDPCAVSELVLMARNGRRIEGLLMDLQGAAEIRPANALPLAQPQIRVSADPAALADMDLVVICAARWLGAGEKARLEACGLTGRERQAYANLELVRELASAIARYAPRATVVVATNQSDLMAEVARRHCPDNLVLGFGGCVDRARLGACLRGRRPPGEVGAPERQGLVVGSHGELMIALGSTFDGVGPGVLAEAIRDAGAQGARISELQRDLEWPLLDAGASILPARALWRMVGAASGVHPALETSFNVAPSADVADHYGCRAQAGVTLPVRVSPAGFEVFKAAIDPAETRALRRRQSDLRAKLQAIMSLRPQAGGGDGCARSGELTREAL